MAFQSRLADRTDVLPKTLVESLEAQLGPLDARFTPAMVSGYGLDASTRSNSPKTTRAVLNVGNDIHFALPALALAKIWSRSTVQGTQAFLYHFNCPNPWDGPWEGEASHILDIAFALQNYNEQLSPGQRQCAERFGKDIVRFVSGQDVWDEYRMEAKPTSMIYSASVDGDGEEDSHLVRDEDSASTGRRTIIQGLGEETVHDKVLHAWQAFMMNAVKQ